MFFVIWKIDDIQKMEKKNGEENLQFLKYILCKTLDFKDI